MGMQKCFSCYRVKDTSLFMNGYSICNYCRGTSGKENNTKIIEHNNDNKKKKTNKYTEETRTKITPKMILIDKIFEFAERNNIEEFSSTEIINFMKTSEMDLEEKYSLCELEDIMDDLVLFKESQEIDLEPVIIDQLEILSRYQYPNLRNDRSDVITNKWRIDIPSFVKKTINWRNDPIEIIYHDLKKQLKNFSGNQYNELLTYICNISDLIFEEKENKVIEKSEDLVLELVEMTILPHLEILDLYEDNQGILTFIENGNESCTESLESEVKERDGSKCIICDNKLEIRLHHRIPTKLKGINHKDNLVTLCRSCQSAIETANVKKAFKTIISNISL